MAEITFDTGAGDAVHEQWGPGGNQYFHFKRATGSDGNSPTCIFVHGTPQESDLGGNAIQPFLASTAGNATAEYLLARGCNIVSLAMERKQTATSSTYLDEHSQGPGGTGLLRFNYRTGGCYVPELFLQVQRAVCFIKYWVDRASYGDPAKFVGLGYSFGGWLHMMAQIRRPIVFDGLAYREEGSSYERPGVALDSSSRSSSGAVLYDSRLRALGNAQAQPDLRRGIIAPAQTPAILTYHAGVVSAEEYALVPDETLEQMSLLWFLEQGLTRWWVPMISGYPTPPENNAGVYPLQDPHDPVQGRSLDEACKRASLAHRLIPNGLEGTDGNAARMGAGLLRYVGAA